MHGARILSGPERDTLLRVAYRDAPVRWRTRFQQFRSAGEDSVEGKPEVNCYDRATGLQVYARSLIPNPMGELVVETRLSDYRKVGPLTLPHRVEHTMGEQKLVISVESIALNESLPADRFARPEEVEELRVGKK